MGINPKSLTEKQLAERWAVTPECLQKMRYENRGPAHFKVGRLVRYRLSAIERFEEENTVEPNATVVPGTVMKGEVPESTDFDVFGTTGASSTPKRLV